MKNLENKAQNASISKLPKTLSAYCNICKEEKIFLYSATQSNPLHITTQFNPLGEDVPIYNCTECNGTRAYQTLIRK